MVILTASDLTLEIGDKTILDSVSFSVNEGDKLGIIGVNGAGKSTLFKLICGKCSPTHGNIFISKGKSIGLLEQNVIITDEDAGKTVLEYMYAVFSDLLEIESEITKTEHRLSFETETSAISSLSSGLSELHDRYAKNGGLEFRSRCRSSLINMGFTEEHLSMPVSSLSGGQHTRLSLARLLAREPDLLLLDEPTNHLDTNALLWLEGFLSSYKKTILLISHDRYFLDRVTNKTLHLRYGKARLYPGNYSAYKKAEETEAASLEKKYKEQQRVIQRIQDNIAFQRKCGMEHNFVTIRAKEKQLARMEKVELAPAPEKSIRIKFDEEKESAGEVVRIKSLTFGYKDKLLFDKLTFTVRSGERVFFLGANGCGKSTLIKLIIGRLVPNGGYCELGYNIKVGYFDQENNTLSESNTVFEEMRSEYPQKTDFELRSTLALFLFGADDIDKKISSLSGGEKARVTLAKLMLKKVNLLIMDEPTNHLDITSREALESALGSFDGTIIAVSHDRYFINALATEIVDLTSAKEGNISAIKIKDGADAFAEYLAEKEKRKNSNNPPENPQNNSYIKKGESINKDSASQSLTTGKESYIRKKEEERQRRMEETKLRRAKERIAELEAMEEKLKAELFSDAAADYVRAAEIDAEIAKIEDELLSLYETVL